MRQYFVLLFLLVLLNNNSVLAQKKLVLVQELFRHGSRYPIYPRSFDGSDYAAKEHSIGELSTQGKAMHYLFGKKVYAAYWRDLFGGTQFEAQYNNSKFYIKSTDVNRTVESCQSHLMGIFENLPKLQITNEQVNWSKPLWPGAEAVAGDIFPNAVQFHPAPVHVQKIGTDFNWKGDFLRNYSPENCPQQDTWALQNQASPFAQQVFNNQRIKRALAALSDAVKQQVSFQEEGYLYDNFQCSSYLGRPTLPVFTGEFKRDLHYIYTLDLYINLFLTDIQIRTTAAGFFQATLKNMHRALKNKDVQWVIYSAHDTTVANMLAAMNMTNAACIYEAYLKGDDYNSETCIPRYPGYTASIIFQVYEDKDTTVNTFKIRYMGEYRKIPFCNYTYECPVETMQKWYDENIKTDNFAATCGIYNDDKQFYKGIAVIEFGIILAFLIYWVMRHLKRSKFPKKKHPHVQSTITAESMKHMSNQLKQELLQAEQKDEEEQQQIEKEQVQHEIQKQHQKNLH